MDDISTEYFKRLPEQLKNLFKMKDPYGNEITLEEWNRLNRVDEDEILEH